MNARLINTRCRGCSFMAGMVLVLLWGLAAMDCLAQPLVDLNAENLTSGKLPVWTNAGLAGGCFEAGSNQPVAAMVAGRKAVQFTDKEWFKSTFNAPNGITGGRPFTMTAWVHPARLVGKQVFLSWASRPKDCAEFGYGKNAEAAFCGWLKDAGYARVPALARWHHIAVSYAGGHLRLYVDGQLDKQADLSLSIKGGDPVMVGAAWDGAKKQPAFGFRGAIATVRIWDRELSHMEIRNDMGVNEPFDPHPIDASEVADRHVILGWQKGDREAQTMRVYVSEDRKPVEDMDKAAFRATVPALGNLMQCDIGERKPGAVCFWRVAQMDQAGGLLKAGPVWSFLVDSGKARNPLPRNKVAGISKGTSMLAWKPGRYVVSQDLYFGDKLADVESATVPLVKGLASDVASIKLTVPLEYGRTYYWRVCEHNGPFPVATGDVWAFRVEDQPLPGQLTFFVVSDTHYGLDWRVEPAVQTLIDKMNFLPGTPLPQTGGVVRTPRGVIHLGDVTNDGKEEQWKMFVRDFGLRGEGRLAYPVYELFGNHDGNASQVVRKSMWDRNRLRAEVSRRSQNGVHYAWDWDGVRFISLNVSVGTNTHPYDPQNSLDFLKEQLGQIKDRSQPLVLLEHFGFDKRESLSWWPEAWRQQYREAIDGFNVLGIFHGHDHETDIYRWEGVDIFDAPHVRDADNPEKPVRHGFFVVQLTGDEMIVAERKLDDTWGLFFCKKIDRLKP